MPPATMTIVMPERGDADDRRLAGDQLEVGAAEELRADEHAEDDRDEQQAEQRAGRVEQRTARCHAASLRLPVGGEHQRRARSSSAPGARRAERAAAHDGDAVAQAEQLGQVAADHEHRAWGVPSRGLGDQRVDRARRSAPCCRRRCRASARRAPARRRRGGAAARCATFCWLPPDSSPTACAARGTDAEPLDPACRRPRCAPGSTSAPGPRPSSRVSVRLSAIVRLSASPSPLRSSLSMPMPCCHDCARRLRGRRAGADA